jgi:hypothetical protein
MGPGANRREQETSDLFAQSLSARVCHHQAGLADVAIGVQRPRSLLRPPGRSTCTSSSTEEG